MYTSTQQELTYKMQATGSGLTEVDCTIYVWSSNGHTPITKRGGSYCDELVKVIVKVSSYSQAQEICNKYFKETEHAAKASFEMSASYWNQNTRNGWGVK